MDLMGNGSEGREDVLGSVAAQTGQQTVRRLYKSRLAPFDTVTTAYKGLQIAATNGPQQPVARCQRGGSR